MTGASTLSCGSPAPLPQTPTPTSTPLAIASGGPASPRASATSAADAAVEAYAYTDGSGNRYALDVTTRKLTYTPIRRGESSSGLYDGGPAWNSELAPAEVEGIVALFKRALVDAAAHTTERAKGTGLVTVLPSKETAILLMQAGVRKELEAALATHFPKPGR